MPAPVLFEPPIERLRPTKCQRNPGAVLPGPRGRVDDQQAATECRVAATGNVSMAAPS